MEPDSRWLAAESSSHGPALEAAPVRPAVPRFPLRFMAWPAFAMSIITGAVGQVMFLGTVFGGTTHAYLAATFIAAFAEIAMVASGDSALHHRVHRRAGWQLLMVLSMGIALLAALLNLSHWATTNLSMAVMFAGASFVGWAIHITNGHIVATDVRKQLATYDHAVDRHRLRAEQRADAERERWYADRQDAHAAARRVQAELTDRPNDDQARADTAVSAVADTDTSGPDSADEPVSGPAGSADHDAVRTPVSAAVRTRSSARRSGRTATVRPAGTAVRTRRQSGQPDVSDLLSDAGRIVDEQGEQVSRRVLADQLRARGHRLGPDRRDAIYAAVRSGQLPDTSADTADWSASGHADTRTDMSADKRHAERGHTADRTTDQTVSANGRTNHRPTLAVVGEGASS